MKAYVLLALLVITSALFSGCGGGGSGGGGGGGGNTHLTASMNTVINASTAVGTISIAGTSLPIIYGLDLKITYPPGVTFNTAVSYGVAQNAPNPTTNIGINEVVISFPSTDGFGAGDVMQVNFSTLPNGTLTSQFGVQLIAVYGAGGTLIQ
jgi:hypothetical protein